MKKSILAYLFLISSGSCISQEKILEKVDQLSEFTGGNEAMNQYFKTYIKYSNTVIEKRISDTVQVKFIVSETGKVSDFKILKGIRDCYECSAEVMNVASSMPKWIPAQVDQKNVSSYRIIKVPFTPVFPESKDEENIIYDMVDQLAEYPGGIDSLKSYILRNIKYPEIALERGIKGKSYAKFVINKNGVVSAVKIIRGISDCKECDMEVVRVLSAMPNWEPAVLNGKRINSYYTIPIMFNVVGDETEPKTKKELRQEKHSK